MDTSAQPSFIPKKPLSGPSVRSGSAAFGMFFLLIAILLFLASVFAAGGSFVYTKYLQGAITSKSDALAKAEEAFDPSTIQDLQRLDARINNASALLQKHVTTVSIFNLLSQQTLESVQLTGFTYSLQANGVAQISLAGVASNFATVALQSDQYGASEMLDGVVFSSVVVGAAGTISFNVNADLVPNLVSYAKNLGNPLVPTAPAPVPAPTTPTPNPVLPTP